MPKVTRTVDVRAPSSVLMGVICDFEQYPSFVGEVLDTELEDVGPDYWRVAFQVALFRKRVNYTLDLRKTGALTIEWSLVTGDWMTGNDGCWALSQLEPNLTRATYTIEISLGTMVPRAVSGLLINASFPRMLGDFRRQAESIAEG